MRTLGAIVVAGMLVVSTGCGGDSKDKGGSSPSGRSAANGGTCPASSSGQTCTGEKEYADCAMAACGAQSKTCFGADFLSGVYTGPCGPYLDCQMKCPCDATATTCEQNCTTLVTTNTECLMCLLTLASCVQSAGCAEPVCQGTGIDAGATGGANCTALQACCAGLVDANQIQACQLALAGAAGNDSICSQILVGFKSQSLCL
jgi:hypothetical protein